MRGRGKDTVQGKEKIRVSCGRNKRGGGNRLKRKGSDRASDHQAEWWGGEKEPMKGPVVSLGIPLRPP